MSSIHFAKFSQSEYKNLKEEFQKYANSLDEIIREIGPNIQIPINKLSQLEATIPSELLNRINKRAYQLNLNHLSSIMIQLQTITELPLGNSNKVLEIGKGQGTLGALLKNFDYNYKSFDIDKNLEPDISGDVTNMKEVDSSSYDVVCAFQVLEHMKYENFDSAIKEMCRVSNNYLFLSLPCEQNFFNFSGTLTLRERILNKLSFNLNLFLKIPRFFSKDIDVNKFNERKDNINPHYWEVCRPSYPKKKILEVMKKNNLKVIKNFHNNQFAYHWFILCKKLK